MGVEFTKGDKVRFTERDRSRDIEIAVGELGVFVGNGGEDDATPQRDEYGAANAGNVRLTTGPNAGETVLVWLSRIEHVTAVSARAAWFTRIREDFASGKVDQEDYEVPELPKVAKEYVAGALYEATYHDETVRLFYRPIDGFRANHPWLHVEGETRIRSDAVTDVKRVYLVHEDTVNKEGVAAVLAHADYDYKAQAEAALKFLGIEV